MKMLREVAEELKREQEEQISEELNWLEDAVNADANWRKTVIDAAEVIPPNYDRWQEAKLAVDKQVGLLAAAKNKEREMWISAGMQAAAAGSPVALINAPKDELMIVPQKEGFPFIPANVKIVRIKVGDDFVEFHRVDKYDPFNL